MTMILTVVTDTYFGLFGGLFAVTVSVKLFTQTQTHSNHYDAIC